MRIENMLKPLTDKCSSGKCKHKKCTCGDCSFYHMSRTWECLKLHQNLTTCKCKKFEEI